MATSDIGPALADAAAIGDKTRNTTMTYTIKPLPFDPQRIKGLSERILLSHYENNYGGAVKRLNAITEQLSSLDYEKAPGFVINGLKREELIATNSMILHEVYFAGLGDSNQPGPRLTEAIDRDFGGMNGWRAEFVAGADRPDRHQLHPGARRQPPPRRVRQCRGDHRDRADQRRGRLPVRRPHRDRAGRRRADHRLRRRHHARLPAGKPAKTRLQYSIIALTKRNTDEWILSGDLA